MAHTNSTENYGLPQWIGTDKPTFLGDFNSAFGTIDTQMKANADASASAVATANSADAVATSANTNASTALNTANQALTDAQSAVSTAGTANSTANTAKTNADTALRASAANTIENLAPAYDPTLTYQVGDLITYVDGQNSGKLYKCIVAVNTPMEFNINYWDDVTTSEVYAKKYELIASAIGDGIKTFKELAEELLAGVTSKVSLTNRLFIVMSRANESWIGECNFTTTAEDYYDFHCDHSRYNGTYYINSEEHFGVNDNGGYYYQWGERTTSSGAVTPTLQIDDYSLATSRSTDIVRLYVER